MAFQIAGPRALSVLAQYGALTYLNRTSRRRPIAKVPRLAVTPPGSAHQARGGAKHWDADIVVPIYNDFDGIKGLLDVLRQEAEQFGRIFLVHDCSTDERLTPLLRAFRDGVPRATLIENERNLGFVQTCNRGLQASEKDVIILNTDIELPPGALGRIFDVLHGSDDIATVTPFSSSAYGAGFPDLNYGNERPFGATTAQIDHAFQTVGPFAPIDIPRGVGFCMAISRRVMEEIGVFDTDFGQGYGEEADFCLRARKAGRRNVIAPNVYVHHRSGQSFGGAWQKKARAGQIRFLERHPDYAGLMRAYLQKGEARAVNFAALAALLRDVTGQDLVVGRALKDATQRTTPRLQIADNRLAARLSLSKEAYEFAFADSDTATEVAKFAGLSL